MESSSTYDKNHYITYYNNLKTLLEKNLLVLKEELETITLWHSTFSSVEERTFTKHIKEGITDLEFQIKNINDILTFLNKDKSKYRTDTKKYKTNQKSPKRRSKN